MAENMILFKRGLKESLPATRDNNTLYFVTNTGELYLGNTLIADKTGDYAAAIANAIGALDATVKDESGLVQVTIVETDGKLTSVTVNQAALLAKFAEYQPKGDYKTVQTAVADPAANGKSLTFIDTISQDTNGKISVTKKNVNLDAYSTKETADGLYAAKSYEEKVDTLIGSEDGDGSKSARTIAAEEVAKIVANADENFDTLKEVADWIANDTEGAAAMQNAIAAIKKEIGGTQGAEGFTNSRIDANEAKLTGITDTVKKYVDDEIAKVDAAGVNDAIDALQSGKADKVSGATAGNFAGLDASGNLTDSGKKAADFATAAQGTKADSAVQSVSLASGTNNGTLKLTVDGTETDNIAVKGLGSAAYVATTAFDAAGAAAAVQGSTTNTVKDCVDAINTLNNTMDSVDTNNKALIGTVNNVVNQLTWGSF